jgi:allantoinase
VVAIRIHRFVIATPNGAIALRQILESMKKQETVWLADTQSVVQTSSVIVSKSE